MSNFIEEIWEEATDFTEDFWEHLIKRQIKKPTKTKLAIINGVATTVRPAYLFAERIDNLLRIFFGISIIVSAATATYFGFSTLSGLLEALISNFLGRILMLIIGLSYAVIAIWKLLHLQSNV